MKTTFKSNEIAHVWAHKSAPEGKSPGAMSFRGDAFYSYGTVIARHIEHKGKAAIILNDTSYSSTTAKHQNLVWRAIEEGIQVFRISNCPRGSTLDAYDFHGNEGKILFEYAVGRASYCMEKAEKAFSRKGYLESQAASWLERAKQVNAFFGLRRKVDENTISRLRESSAKAEREASRKETERLKKQYEEQSADYVLWVNGETEQRLYFNPRLFPVAFRIEGEELVSTLGARVPIAHAKRALAFVLAHREAGWHRNGSTHHVGLYQLDAISSEGVQAGCHRITWEEIERLTSILS